MQHWLHCTGAGSQTTNWPWICRNNSIKYLAIREGRGRVGRVGRVSCPAFWTSQRSENCEEATVQISGVHRAPLSHSQAESTLATHQYNTGNMKFNLFRHIKDQEDDSPFITSSSEYKYLPRKFRKGKTKSSVEYSEPRHRKSGKLLQGRIFKLNRKSVYAESIKAWLIKNNIIMIPSFL